YTDGSKHRVLRREGDPEVVIERRAAVAVIAACLSWRPATPALFSLQPAGVNGVGPMRHDAHMNQKARWEACLEAMRREISRPAPAPRHPDFAQRLMPVPLQPLGAR